MRDDTARAIALLFTTYASGQRFVPDAGSDKAFTLRQLNLLDGAYGISELGYDLITSTTQKLYRLTANLSGGRIEI